MTDDADHTAGLVEHFFRHEYGRLVAQLANKVGARHVELVEDAVQGALATALTAWVAKGLPRDPSAWLYRVACNQLVGVLRQDAGRLRILADVHDLETADATPSAHFADEVRDDLLRMLFVSAFELRFTTRGCPSVATYLRRRGLASQSLDGPVDCLRDLPWIRTDAPSPRTCVLVDRHGMGLAIARKIAIEHGGELSLAPDKAPTGGARFVITLPLRGPEASMGSSSA